ncbi:DUF1146 family protein [Companilactobacillus alimentarius]|uniref:DUF1146 domain-containing protein n=1 Tax=Companilactobacillus alimentarius DSM 20249 TaxID=1423720 RepID=A0A2K9HF03_9LACO|nr:DUF1146 family protein [Companilactobacillus alimentarius]AUI70948.1 hypothetical protein LA20249_01485 [Companilactobacillus alimentarius DSM 20249]MDT6951803.1 DUF1146 family protein [Companilactobacillus alimentarius]GEO44165.1 membrane protein [Companilactobacillus alimentarius]
MTNLGINAIITLVSHIIFIWISFNILQVVDWKKIYNKTNPKMLQLLVAFISIALGYTVSSFFMSIFSLSQNIVLLFK